MLSNIDFNSELGNCNNEIDQIKVSVVTVCYNSAGTLERTIQSVLGQTYKNIEYIVVDGGSSDGTTELIKKYEGKISAWISEPDRGLYDAMNKGIRMATGDVVGIINSDDWYAEDAVEKVAECFCSRGADIVHGDMTAVSKDGRCWARSSPPKDAEEIFFHMAYYHPTVFVRTGVYRKYGTFDCRYKIAADYQMLLRFYATGVGFFYLRENIAYFRLGGLSGEKKLWRTAIEERNVALEHFKGRKHGVGESVLARIDACYQSARLRAISAFIEKKTGCRYVKAHLSRLLNGKKSIAVFGAGYWGVKYYDWFERSGISVAYFVDNAPAKQNGRLGEAPVKPPDALKADKGEVLTVVVIDGAREELERQLKSFGLRASVDYVFIGDLQKEMIRRCFRNFSECVLIRNA